MEDGAGKVVPHKTPKNLTNNKYQSSDDENPKEEVKPDESFSDENIERKENDSDKDSIKDETIE